MRAFLIAALAASVVFAPGSASAAACSWATADLPLPAGTRFSTITGAASDGSYVLGRGVAPLWQDVALLWHNGSVESVPLGPGHVPKDVNASGTVLINTPVGRAFRGGTELNPLPGANWAGADAINSAGDAVGVSGDAVGGTGTRIAIWPADSSVPRMLSGTDDGAGWSAEGIDAQGRVAGWRYGGTGETEQAYAWDENGVRALLRPLPGHTDTVVRSIRNGRIVGFSANDGWTNAVGVEWDVQGNVVRTLTGAADAMDVTSSGDILGRTGSIQLPGPVGVWRAGGDIEQPPDYIYGEFTDSGSLYGSSYREGTYVPVHVRCA